MTDFYCPSCKTSWNGRYNTTHRCDTCNTPVRVKTAAPEATWISVEDRLPNGPEKVLCFGLSINELGAVQMRDTAYHDGAHWCDYHGSRLISNGEWKITHWMPLPAPPGGDR